MTTAEALWKKVENKIYTYIIIELFTIDTSFQKMYLIKYCAYISCYKISKMIILDIIKDALSGLPLVREKSGKFKVREKSGNFRICQGNLLKFVERRKFEKSQGNLRKLIFHKRFQWSISISKKCRLAPSAMHNNINSLAPSGFLWELWRSLVYTDSVGKCH